MFQDTKSGSDNDNVKVIGIQSSEFLDDKMEDKDDVNWRQCHNPCLLPMTAKASSVCLHLEPSLFAPIEDM